MKKSIQSYIPLMGAVGVGRYYSGKESLWDDLSYTTEVAYEHSGLVYHVAVLMGFGLLLWYLFRTLVKYYYHQLVKDNALSLNDWLMQPEGPSVQSQLQLLVTHWMSAGGHVPRVEPVPLGQTESPFLPGLKVVVPSSTATTTALAKDVVVVGTIRMGFGHHRIAYAACSWSLGQGTTTYFHDLLNITSPEATLIQDMDKMYSKGSRLASELGGVVEQLWGALTLSGGTDALRATYQMAEVVKPLLLAYPKDTPIVATHSLVALTAVACGFTNVINLVIDNHAQWFVVVPKALNLVQGPTNYHNFLKMGVPPQELQLVGHWIPKDLCENVNHDCQARIQRRRQGSRPLRLLIPVGGAGAQRAFVTQLVQALLPAVAQGTVQLWLNAGDHVHMRQAFIDVLEKTQQDYTVISTLQGVHDFVNTTRSGQEPVKPITLFTFQDYFPAVATTDLLVRVTDVLACKPSELAFYPVPKLHIRRVGDHEQYSALRASELGDGTLEARHVQDALNYIHLFQTTPLLVNMNEKIMENGKIGIYDGCKKAIEIARQMKRK